MWTAPPIETGASDWESLNCTYNGIFTKKFTTLHGVLMDSAGFHDICNVGGESVLVDRDNDEFCCFCGLGVFLG